jgi:nucleoside-diphosphate-sugar epimerase
VIRAVELCCVRDAAVGEVFNIGNPRAVISVRDLARLVKRIAGSKSPMRFVENLDVEVDLRVPDISRARAQIGFDPKIDLEEGLTRTVAAMRREGTEIVGGPPAGPDPDTAVRARQGLRSRTGPELAVASGRGRAA